MMADERSAIGQRAQFARKQLWVTAYDPAQRYPAGDYPAQSEPGQGMPEWIAAKRSLRDADLVLWITIGVNHIVRPGEWPIAPAHRAGFKLRPWGFFDRNPALDVPAPSHCDHETGMDHHHSPNGHS